MTTAGKEIVEQQESTEGWAVFSHCEGEEPRFVAFFAGASGKALAEELQGRRDSDGDPVIFDSGIAPAVIVSESPEEGLFAANHYDNEAGIAALSSFSRIDFERWTS